MLIYLKLQNLISSFQTLMISATIATGFFNLALGFQIHLGWGPPWTTAVLVYLLCIAYTAGPGNVPFVLLGELFLPEVGNYCQIKIKG